MFEIGNSLREARLRQGLEFPELEQATKIRGKYLRALEDEQFDILPGQTYVKGFLRTYSEFLGLDGQLYVDEYNSRYIPGDEETPLRASSTSAVGRNPRVESSVVLVALAAIGILTALVVAAWQFGSNAPDAAIPDFSSQPPVATTKAKPRNEGANKRPRPATVAKVTATAALGNSWMEVYAGSPAGRLLYRGTLEAGQFVRFTRPKLFVVMGRPGNVRLKLNGKVVRVPDRGGPTSIIVTPRGVTAAPSPA
jgi:cytoskeleton protein RodZ